MTRASILERFDQRNVWSRDGQRASHEPLLVLYALGRWSCGQTADISFAEIDAQLTEMPKEYSDFRQSSDRNCLLR